MKLSLFSGQVFKQFCFISEKQSGPSMEDYLAALKSAAASQEFRDFHVRNYL